LGDPSGIGPEVTARALESSELRRLGHFIVIGDKSVFRKYSKKSFSNVDICDINALDGKKYKVGTPNKAGAEASIEYLNTAINLLKSKSISSLVTAPLCKETISSVVKGFRGHTEYLADAFGRKNVGMLFVADHLKTIIATRHIPLKRVPIELTQKSLLETILLTDHALKKDFKISKPKIGVCGINPHAGEGGLLGREEITTIIPAMKKARSKKINVFGPLSADTLFIKSNSDKFDAIVAIYHDQGLAPMKGLYFDQLVNMTIGLPFVRTSPAHGTAFDIAGKNKADASSMKAAIRLAATLCR
jgi:4-hydroxythreonine-4-phosphate dehydrogenase